MQFTRCIYVVLSIGLVSMQLVQPAFDVQGNDTKQNGYFHRLKRGLRYYLADKPCSAEDKRTVHQAFGVMMGAVVIGMVITGCGCIAQQVRLKKQSEIYNRVKSLKSAIQKQNISQAQTLLNEIKQEELVKVQLNEELWNVAMLAVGDTESEAEKWYGFLERLVQAGCMLNKQQKERMKNWIQTVAGTTNQDQTTLAQLEKIKQQLQIK